MLRMGFPCGVFEIGLFIGVTAEDLNKPVILSEHSESKDDKFDSYCGKEPFMLKVNPRVRFEVPPVK